MREKYDSANVAILKIVSLLVTIAGVVVSIFVAVSDYNHRYDADATAADEIAFSFYSGDDTCAGTINMSAGTVYCGYYQILGTTASSTKYEVYSKKSSKKSYTLYDTVYLSPNTSDGDYKFKSSWFSQKYDINVKRKTNKDTTSSFRMDFAVM